MRLYYDIIVPEKFGIAYQELAKSFGELGESPMRGLDERVRQASLILKIPTPQRTDDQWGILVEVKEVLVLEARRYNTLEEQRKA